MKFEAPLVEARLLKRYKRFLADVRLADGTQATAHCANPGSMMGLCEPGSKVWLSPNRNPKAKLDWRWELVEAGGALVGINTARANRIVEEALAAGRVPGLDRYEKSSREVAYGESSRIDFLLEEPGRAYVEVKSVTLARDGFAEFPDAPTKRGAKHLDELARMARQGHRAVMFYLVQRGDCEAFRLARDIDPVYGAAFDRARTAGLEVMAYSCRLTPGEITLEAPLQFRPEG